MQKFLRPDNAEQKAERKREKEDRLIEDRG